MPLDETNQAEFDELHTQIHEAIHADHEIRWMQTVGGFFGAPHARARHVREDWTAWRLDARLNRLGCPGASKAGPVRFGQLHLVSCRERRMVDAALKQRFLSAQP